MFKKVNWLQHSVELIVVFIGVTSAFMLHAWRESRLESQLERKFLESLYEDVLYDSSSLASVIETNEYFL